MQLITPTDIGMAIRERRLELGLGQQALADRVGTSRQWIVGIEQGKPRAEVGLLLKTLRALDLRIEVLPEGVARRPPGGRSVMARTDPRDVDIDAVVERARRWP